MFETPATLVSVLMDWPILFEAGFVLLTIAEVFFKLFKLILGDN